MTTSEVGFLGYGRMAQAISEGLDRSGVASYAKQAASDVRGDHLEKTAKERGFLSVKRNSDLFELCPLVVVAVKPHQVRGVLEEVRPAIGNHLIVSIAAGVSLDLLSSLLPPSAGLVRVIPNLPALVGKGMTLLCAPKDAPPNHLLKARELFEAVGSTAVLDESLFEDGTAVSGSGPAFFFMVMEAMIRAGARQGLTWELSRELTLRTALGAAETALARPEASLAELRDQVASPGGTTAEGLLRLEKGRLTALFHDAVKAAADKGRGLV
jgi:pyrroline-5-carboxylate reductase